MIGELNCHPDPLVAQYSIWATVENANLSIEHLKLPLADLESQPENVRGWVFRLLASDPVAALKYRDVIHAGSRDASSKARAGLAEGIRHTTFPDIDKLVLGWFIQESNDGVRQHLLDHMALNADMFPRYASCVLDLYRAAGRHSLARARIEAASRGTLLYQQCKTIELDADRNDLFGSATVDKPSLASAKSSHNQRDLATPAFPDRNDVRLLVVTALPKELAAVLATMSITQRIGDHGDPIIYHLGYYSDFANAEHRAALVCQSGMGNNNAAATVANALRSFPSIEHIVMTGIAGGCPHPTNADEHVRLGDVIFSNNAGILEYDFVKQSEGGSQIRSAPQQPSARMLAAANILMADELRGIRSWDGHLEAALDGLAHTFRRPSDETDLIHAADGSTIPHPNDNRRAGKPKVRGGGIGTADILQKNPTVRDALREVYGIRAIEMEAGGVQTASWVQGRDVMIVRGICDYCDAYKNDVWQDYAALAAAAFTKSLVLAMPLEWFPHAPAS